MSGERSVAIKNFVWDQRIDIDDAKAVWLLAAKTKPGRDNAIPLPPFVVALVAEADLSHSAPNSSVEQTRGADWPLQTCVSIE